MQCGHNTNNDKLALLDTIYNQTFKHFTHLIYIQYILVFLMSILMSFDTELQQIIYECNVRNVLLTKECDSLV